MLAGKKRLAWFSELDPVEAFAPHVENGAICRFEWRDHTRNLYERFRNQMRKNAVLFDAAIYHLPGEEARVEEFMHAIRELASSTQPDKNTMLECKIGKLLDYPSNAIDAYLERRQQKYTKK